jgi:deoxycytidylate deaminase
VLCEIRDLETGKSYWGENVCSYYQYKCPRGDMEPGVGYELCDSMCGQEGHAEEQALEAAGKDQWSDPFKRALALVYGQTRVCERCKDQLQRAGVETIILVKGSEVI